MVSAATPIIRRYRAVADDAALRGVFHSAIHRVASRDYTPEQIAVWAPDTFDAAQWAQRMRGIDPWVAEIDGEVVGYADVQDTGYIDHFYVSGHHPRRGIGTALMRHLHGQAQRMALNELTSHVSLTAQPFFSRFGFVIVEQRMPVVRGVAMSNALMRKPFDAAA